MPRRLISWFTDRLVMVIHWGIIGNTDDSVAFALLVLNYCVGPYSVYEIVQKNISLLCVLPAWTHQTVSFD